METKIGEIEIIRGSPAAGRTLEVTISDDWLVGSQLEKCVSFQELRDYQGKTIVVFSRSISAQEARGLAGLLCKAADALESEIEPEKTETLENEEG